MRWVRPITLTLALVATGAHAQGIELSGEAKGGLVYDSDAADGQLSPLSEVSFSFQGTGQSDNGLAFGALIDIDETGIDGSELFLSGSFGTLTMGSVDPATDGFGIADLGFSGIGIDDVAEQYKNATAGADVEYSYARGGLTLTASAEIGDENSLGLAARYARGAFNLGVGYVDDTDAANSTVSVIAGYSFGSLAINGLYSDWSEGGQGLGVDLSVDAGAATVTAVWAQASGTVADTDDGIGDAYGIGLSVPLSDGLTLSGGLGVIETDAAADGSRTVADFGVKMNF